MPASTQHWTIVGLRAAGAEGWRPERVDPRSLPDGVALWPCEEDVVLAGGYLHDHHCAALVPPPYQHTHVSQRGRAVRVTHAPPNLAAEQRVWAAALSICLGDLGRAPPDLRALIEECTTGNPKLTGRALFRRLEKLRVGDAVRALQGQSDSSDSASAE